ncbi:DUF6851 domain-containing protein [Agriterribacter sp.]|uniref:vanadium-dependent haloperoxidase n=1 Tax=Agriterribacter sp. TaxID=2821509 RepID=UPI002C47874F|nr:hypothetical protein [Agriterribacter sp.]HRO45277.1 hypothetical protein [Agriterribacter sp.]HRQ16880.1 hypothetical protein [Agriterribacter sp.]
MSANTIKPIALQWNQLALNAIRYSKTSPPLAARALAMLHTATYDAWSVYTDGALSTRTALYIKIKDDEKCRKDNRRKAVSYAAYRVLVELFWLVLPAQNKNMFRGLMHELDYDPADTSLDITMPQGIGNVIAKLVIEYRAGDGSNPYGTLHMPSWSDYTGYTPVNTWDKVNDLNYWQPLRTMISSGQYKIQHFPVPHWGLIQSFSLNYNGQFRPEPPFKKHQSQFKDQAREILTLSAALTDKQKAIAAYWADGPGTYTPAGHWCEIAQFVAVNKKYGDSDCIKLFFVLSNALLDASIACWECKHRYNSVRPVTAIRELYRGKDIQAWGGAHKGRETIKGEEWQSYIATPPFPEHVSVHSTFSRAAATILQYYTGSDQFGGCTVIEKGCSAIEKGTVPTQDITLEWDTFTAAAEQAGKSGLYGGTHFSKGDRDGQKLGAEIGKCVWEKALFYFND